MKGTWKRIALLALIATMGCMACSCSGSEDTKETEAPTEAPTEATTVEEETEAPTVAPVDAEMEEAVAAADDEAYLAVVDGQWWIQNWGNENSDGKNQLCYGQKVAKITGNGSYTVSVDATTNAFHYDTETGPEYTCGGCSFMAVMINDGEKLFPNMVITIDSILVDGEEVELKAKNYTSSDEGVVTRANIYNEWVVRNEIKDALQGIENGRCAEGPFFDADGNYASFLSDDLTTYSAQIIDPATLQWSSWSTIEVNFTVSGIDDAAAGESVDANADADAESTDAAAE